MFFPCIYAYCCESVAAKILGRSEAPLTYRRTKAGSPSPVQFGVNFAVGGAGVFEVPRKAPTLAKQIDYFEKMLDGRTIGKWRLRQSVALVAISGNDYARVGANVSSDDGDMIDFIGNVTGEIAKGVNRLRKLGVTKVLVNTLHPLACTPWQSRPSNYTKCVGRGNMAADLHNDDLRRKLMNTTPSDGVYLLDLNRAFTAIINPSDSDTGIHLHIFVYATVDCFRSYAFPVALRECSPAGGEAVQREAEAVLR